MMTTTIKHILVVFIFSTFMACNDSNYKGENYTAFGSMDELSHNIVESIQEQNEEKMLGLLDNQVLLFDLLAAAQGQDAYKTKAYLATEEGKKRLDIEKMAKKQRINAFFSTGLSTQIKNPPSAFKIQKVELIQESPYAQGSPALLQNYQIVLENGSDQSYGYTIDVIFWNNYYHLVEAAGFLEQL